MQERYKKAVATRKSRGNWFKTPDIGQRISEGKKTAFQNLPPDEQELRREHARQLGKRKAKPKGKCKNCNEQLIGQQKTFCSRSCRNKFHPCVQKHKMNGKWISCPICGIDLYRKASQLKEVNYCSRSCWAKARKGSKNANWKGGVTPDWNKHHSSREHAQWRRKIVTRDKWTCRSCGIKNNLHAHHIKPVRTHPELALNVDNGITLCLQCHVKVHKNST